MHVEIGSEALAIKTKGMVRVPLRNGNLMPVPVVHGPLLGFSYGHSVMKTEGVFGESGTMFQKVGIQRNPKQITEWV